VESTRRKLAIAPNRRGPVHLAPSSARDGSLTEAEIKALLVRGFDRARGIEIDDLYPPSLLVEPPEEVFREMLLAGCQAIRGIEIDDVFPANSTAGRSNPG
jgi:hypothetical protein